ncbi:hypothetical protein [Hypericibacter sp.]|uniref:hypothetical protein n=1 Tax=Hypericibacter sp. TaxID=2705401 RepID=UPI003D6D66CB
MKILGVLALLLTVLSGVSACANKPVEQSIQTQSGSGGGGSGSSGGGGSGGGGGGRY